MASNLRVDTILPSTGTSLGIGTASGTTTVTGNLVASSASVTGNLGVGGVLTYEDVTNIDSVGVITARDGLRVTGIATISGSVSIGDSIVHTGDTNTAIRFPSADTITTETGGLERLRIDSSGRLGIGANNNDSYDNNARNVLIASSGNTGITIRSGGSSNYAMIHFADGTTGAAQQRAGRILYEHSTDSLQISTANTFAFKIDSNGYVTKPSHPSFCARFQSGDTFVSTNIFRLTLINNDNFSWNTGSHYSTTTGKFTAPVAGVYFFEAQAMTTGWSNGNDTQDMLELRTNNGLVTYGRQRRSYFRSEDDANGYYVNGTAGQVNLAAGDTVWFQKRAALSYGFGNVNYTYFTGWLIG